MFRTEEQLSIYCERCTHYAANLEMGVYCNLTGSQRDLSKGCEDYTNDPEREQHYHNLRKTYDIREASNQASQYRPMLPAEKKFMQFLTIVFIGGHILASMIMLASKTVVVITSVITFIYLAFALKFSSSREWIVVLRNNKIQNIAENFILIVPFIDKVKYVRIDEAAPEHRRMSTFQIEQSIRHFVKAQHIEKK